VISEHPKADIHRPVLTTALRRYFGHCGSPVDRLKADKVINLTE
jgi:hypothetical protein